MRFSTGQLIFLLFFAIAPIASEEGGDGSEQEPITTTHHPRRRVVYRTTPPATLPKCVHGEMNEAGRCICEVEFVGVHCEKKKNCATFRRYRNGTCVSCMDGYAGPFCEDIICDHGVVDPTGLKCICEKPWIGEFCADLQTQRVLSYYNNKVLLMGPLGALSIIPMWLILHFCEKMAHKRQVKRVHEQMGEDADKRVLESLLKKDEDPGMLESLLKKEDKEEHTDRDGSVASNV